MRHTILRRIFALSVAMLTLSGMGMTTITADFTAAPAMAASVTGQNYRYTVNTDNTLTITRYTGSESTANIPRIIDGKLVTAIGDSAFNGCTRLQSIVIPSGVRTISGNAFIGCSNLQSFAVNSSNRYYTAVSGVLFSKNQTTLKAYPGGRSGAYTVPANVILIDSYAFSECNKLTAVTISGSVKTIGFNAFAYCQGLKKATLNSGITILKSGAFNGCKNLTAINLPNSITTIDRNAFSGCRSLKSIAIPSKVTVLNFSLLEGCTSLSRVSIPNGITKVYSNVFDHCNALTSVTLPQSVKNIYGMAFCCCPNLTSVTIQSKTAQIDKIAFTNCPKVTIYGTKGSTAETAAKANGVAFSTQKAPVQNLSAVAVSGRNITVNAKATDGTAPYTYAVYYKKSDANVWRTAQNYSANSTIRFTVPQAGTYRVYVSIWDAEGRAANKDTLISVR